MTSSISNTSQISGKSLSVSSHTPIQQQTQATAPAFESSSRRSSSHSGSSFAAPRNNQSSKKKHRNQRRPQLGDEDAFAESQAMRNTTGRRGQTSITHLMNFSLPPRPQYNNALSGRVRRNPTYGLGSGHHAIDKARFIHANYRFLVSPSGNYHSHAIDADLHLEWSNVLQILASAESQTSSCPICLSAPVAPRMAKCGHIFCLPCLIRYMHSTDETDVAPQKRARWKKCPVCVDSIYISETKPVRWFTGQEGPPPREGEDVVLRLVMRQPGSTLALPRDGADVLGKSEDIPWYFAAEVADYARIMKGSEEYMMAQFDMEMEQLLLQEKEDEIMFGEETEWTKKAISSIGEAKEKMKGIGNPPAAQKPREKNPRREAIQYNSSDSNVPDMYMSLHAGQSGQSGCDHNVIDVSGDSAPPLTFAVDVPKSLSSTSAATSNTEAHHPDQPYFFYQALLHYYLAPLDIRILKAAFGNFAAFPSTLLPRVERVSTGHIIDDEMRKRMKYLAHLPYGCEVGFLECNWTDVVVPDVLEKFKDEIEKRRRKNREKENREEKDRVRAERLEDNERWAAARRARQVLSEENFSGDDFQPLAASLEASAASPPWQSRQGSSFASLASPSTSPSHPRTVWGTSVVTASSPELHVQQEPDGDDGWLQGWERELMAENELIAQVQAVSLNGEGSSATMPPTGGGKKKKKQKITLMSTTARRAA